MTEPWIIAECETTMLITYCQNNDTENALSKIKGGIANVNATCGKGNTIFLYCSRFNNTILMNALLDTDKVYDDAFKIGDKGLSAIENLKYFNNAKIYNRILLICKDKYNM